MAASTPQTTPIPTAQANPSVWLALAGVLLGLLFVSLNQTIIGTAMPRIVADLGGMEHYAWAATSFLLTSTAAVPIFGKLSDNYGRRPFFIAGIILFMITSALCGLSQSMLQLIIFRAMQGVAGGIVMANAFAIIGDLFPPKQRGKWQGVMGSVFGVSSVIGPALGGWLTDGPGWRWVFYINIPVGLIAVTVLIIGLPKIATNNARPIDWVGATALVATVVPLLLALSWGGTEYAWGSIQIIGLLAIALVSLVVLLINETRAEDPIIPLSLFRNRIFSISIGSGFFLGVAMFGSIIYIPLYAQSVLGMSATSAGLAIAPMMLSMVTASTTGGWLVSRTGRYKWAIVLGLFTMLVGMLLLSQLNIDTDESTLVRNMIVLGLGVGLVMPTVMVAVQNAFSHRQLGVVTSSVQFFRQIGGTIGVAVMGAFLTRQVQQGLQTGLDPELLETIPNEVLENIEPQAIVSPDETAALQAEVETLPNGTALFEQLMTGLRESMAAGIQDIFTVAAVVAVLAVAIGIFIPESPLKTSNDPDSSDEMPPPEKTVTAAAPDVPKTVQKRPTPSMTKEPSVRR